MLEESRALGFLGPGPIEAHLVHAQGYLDAGAVAGARRALDLGSGGGVPGLVLAQADLATTWVLLDSNQRRCAFLRRAVEDLGWSDRVTVWEGRAEEAGRSELRSSFELVVARSFGPPAVTAECAAPLLSVGGALVVSEPPESVERWPAAPLATLGLRPRGMAEAHGHFMVLDQVEMCPAAYPRRSGIPRKRPLF